MGLYGTIPPLAQVLSYYFGMHTRFLIIHNLYFIKRVIDARKFPNSSMVGTGLSMEGIDQNYVVYDFMLEMGLRSQSPNLNKW